MSTPLQVLIVEDSQSDIQLLVRELQQGGYEPIYERVQTPESLKAALDKHPWDIVIADYTMPHFRGTDALMILREKGLGTPFIFVSGIIGEDRAVAAMQSGAQDYVIKGNLKRLVPAIDRELREAALRRERKHAEEHLRRHQEHIKTLHEVGQAISSTLDLHTVLNLLLEKISFFVAPMVLATVRLVNGESGGLEPVACSDFNSKQWLAEGRGSRRDPDYIVLKSKTPVTIVDLQTDPRTHDNEFFNQENLLSYLGVPLIAKGDVLGILSLYTRKEHRFAREEIEFLSTLAGQAAIAIQNCQLYGQIKKQAMELERVNKMQREFLSITSHELRAPLSAVMGYLGLMLERSFGGLSPEQEKILARVLSRSKELLSMINSILYAGSLETEGMTVGKQDVDLTELLESLKSDFNVALEKEIGLQWDYPEDLPIIRTDGAMLRHILQNLINNAIKFTAEGRINVTARCLPVRRAVEFKVSDTGIGMPKEALPLIFEKFHQLNSSQSRLYGGVGLGLYIVKQFTQRLGATVDVDSEPGRGSTFTVTLPCRNPVCDDSPPQSDLFSDKHTGAAM